MCILILYICVCGGVCGGVCVCSPLVDEGHQYIDRQI